MLLVLILTGIKQYFDPTTNNKSLVVPFVLFFAYLGGALLDHLQLFESWGMKQEHISILRLVLTVINLVMTKISTDLFPQIRPSNDHNG
jgi:hypothetical protein